MTSRLQQIVEQLESLHYEGNDHCVADLYEALADFQSVPDRETAIPAMFAIIERHPDADLGAPGPLVHEIEAIGGYDVQLEASLARAPTHLTCWMANRILNAETDDGARQRWIAALRKVATDDSASADARDSAREFLEDQGEDV